MKERAPDRRNYRKLYQRTWCNPDFIGLSDLERTVALYLLSGPQSNRIGFFRLSLAAAAEDLARDQADVQAALRVVCVAFGWEFDTQARVLWIPSWWSFNPVENPKNLKGYLTDLSDLPRTPLAAKFCANLAQIPDALHYLFDGWVRVLTPTERRSETPTPTEEHRRIGDAIGDAVTDRTTETQTETQTETETQTRAREAIPPPVDVLPAPGPQWPRGGVLAGSLPRDHRAHAWCGTTDMALKCVPAFVHREFVQALGGPSRDAGEVERQLTAFYESVDARLRVESPNGEDPAKFWRREFAARHQAVPIRPDLGKQSTRLLGALSQLEG